MYMDLKNKKVCMDRTNNQDFFKFLPDRFVHHPLLNPILSLRDLEIIKLVQQIKLGKFSKAGPLTSADLYN